MKKVIAIMALLTILVLMVACAPQKAPLVEQQQATATDTVVNDIESEVLGVDDLLDSDMSDLDSLDQELAELDLLEFE